MRLPVSVIDSLRAAVVASLLVAGGAQAQATAPTAGRVDPASMDATWQKSGARFDAERQRLLARVAQGAATGPFRANWASLQGYRAPGWYEDAKFGIFVHWGIYTVPEFGNEWYSRNMYKPGTPEFAHHVATFGTQDTFGYKDLIPRFTAPRFDPKDWAKLFHDAGARYVVPVAEHHDGFAMYDSQLSDWTAVKMGPHRDVVGELASAIRAEGMHLGLSSHRAEHDWFFDNGRTIASDVNDPRYADFYGPAHTHVVTKGDLDLASDWTYVSQAWLDDWTARTAEIVERYHPDLIYFDWWMGHPTFRNSLPPLLAYYYNDGAARGGVVLDYKLGALPEGAGTLDVERGQLDGIHPTHWQTDTSIGNASWSYVVGDTYKSPETIVHTLVDVVAKNGNLLLNVGPKADGSISTQERATLLAIGQWLKVNGDAIYASKPWRVFGEGPTQNVSGTMQEGKAKPFTAQDIRFTERAGVLYAIALGWPAEGKLVIHSIRADDHVRSVTMLAGGKAVDARQQDDGLHLTLPAKALGQYAYVFRLDR
ncbi:alpha-L-fucosidase [Luteibacter sp. Sphag1AF]|uniref:alpha-L-fucosidase n=1 Tax=Luteibacter sp. Sphag1AF TaxID=2587031 RepID=UPI0016076354|nr:alpha-L-fucosidase [Luteibacter sp. Sphag1AF]MBB3226020.1 alpha-L-fucosidase [Luteibacter sp. Sphag1AF]